MLSVVGNSHVRTCRGYSRRQFLQIGSLALGGLSLPGLLQARAAAGSKMVKDRAVVMLFLQGGPSQIETFDPKMTAPAEIRSITGELPTRLPGVTFGGTFPRLAARADRLAVVRSFASGNGDHQNYMTVAGGDNPFKAPMGTLYTRVAGANHPRTGIPSNVIVTPEAVQEGLKLPGNFETQSLQKLVASSTNLGASYSFFDPSGAEVRQNLQLQISRDRFEDRRSLLAQLDRFKRQLDRIGDFDRLDIYQQQASETILRGVGEAFDLSREDARTLARYDTSHLFQLADVHRWGDMRRSSNLLGKQMVLARRLVEAGAGFVTVMDAGWDMHSNGNSPKNLAGMNWLGHQVDHAVAAFLDDLDERGLADQVLLIVTGEMGRTPKINKNGGRDHWAQLTPLLLAGGGFKMGQVIGQSDHQAGAPASEKYTPKHLLATVMNFLFDLGEVRVAREVPKNVMDAVTAGQPIQELL
jgi:hypothetical protein